MCLGRGIQETLNGIHVRRLSATAIKKDRIFTSWIVKTGNGDAVRVVYVYIFKVANQYRDVDFSAACPDESSRMATLTALRR